MGRHGADVLLADAVEVGGDAHLCVHLVDPVDEGAGELGVACALKAADAGELGELRVRGGPVGAQDVGEDDGVRQAVRRAVEAAQAVGDAVDVSDVAAGEGDAGGIRGREHVAAGVLVVAVEIRLVEVVVDQAHGLDGGGAGVGVRAAADVGLDGVGERVHAGLRRDGGREPDGEARVVHGVARDEHEVVDGVLVVRGRVGDHGGQGDL